MMEQGGRVRVSQKFRESGALGRRRGTHNSSKDSIGCRGSSEQA